ncbi:MAG: hypothetical protein ACI87E_004944, partial [Mariniblastus sp.]
AGVPGCFASVAFRRKCKQFNDISFEACLGRKMGSK